MHSIAHRRVPAATLLRSSRSGSPSNVDLALAGNQTVSPTRAGGRYCYGAEHKRWNAKSSRKSISHWNDLGTLVACDGRFRNVAGGALPSTLPLPAVTSGLAGPNCSESEAELS
jgi:hypothetical protein